MEVDENSSEEPMSIERNEKDEPDTTEEEWDIFNEYGQLEKISEGAYGIVYKAIDLQSQETVAIKMIHFENEEDGIPVTSLREISLLRELKHPNIVRLGRVILDVSCIFLVFEYISMDLRDYINSLPDGVTMSTIEQKTFLYQILRGVCHCHERRIMHRDLKPQNLLVSSEGIIKLADFGLARAVSVPMRAYTHEIATLWYRPPEILLGENRYSFGVDIWSVGCIFAEMAARTPLFKGDSEITQLFSIFSIMSTPTEDNWHGVSQLPNYHDTFPQWKRCCLDKALHRCMDSEGLKILKAMIKYNPAERISAKELLKNPYFNDIDWEKLTAAGYDNAIKLYENY
ncbi:cell division control protein 2 homolog, putative [Brugia malayi]|uniref:Bm4787 n=2 Tax=Brugia malayi TaxID=6279 RepID=A0A0J9XX08_BRUMA|nr:cell division control protein 2 homolog, putative [Brugia malayi]CDP97084.1 Bm4787 [Brugia malayi]VIO85888.1 cell division control protein 2 homolog, putative [Brugia malayi]